MTDNNTNPSPPKTPNIPSFLSQSLKDHDISRDDIIFSAESDLSNSHVRCESHIFVTDSKLYIISGSLGLSENSKASVFRRKKYREVFHEIEFAEQDLSSFESFAYEEQISSAHVIGTEVSGELRILACATNTMKGQLTELSDFLKDRFCKSSDDKAETTDEKDEHGHPRGPHGTHGGHPHGQRNPHGPHGPHGGKTSPKGPQYCPKCGKKYTDPRRQICLHCMEKGKILKRLMSFIIKYKAPVIITIATLVFTGALGIVTPYISSGFYYDEVLTVGGKHFGAVLFAVSLIILTKIMSTVVTIINNIVNARIAANLQNDLKDIIFSSIEKLSLRYFTDKQTGGLMNQVNNDARTIYWFFTGGIPYYLVNIVQIIAVLIIMLIIKTDLTLMYLITVPFIFFMGKHFFSSMGKYHHLRYVNSRKLNALISDTFSGMRVVKAFSKEKSGSVRFASANKRSAAAERTASRFSTINFPMTQVLMLISNSLVLGFGGWMVIKGDLEYGELMTFTAYTAMIYSPMQSFVHMTYEATDSLNAMGRLVEVMDAETDVREADDPIVKEVFDGDVEFKDVDFGYDKTRMVLTDINFNIKSGTVLGIVGHTGAGKSTLANILMRMYDVDRGEIKIDGIPIKDIAMKNLRENIAIVSQETYLFVGTILENIRYANPEASYEDVVRVSKISGAHDFIIKLPDAYETKIGFGQRDLSGGERQRLSIARALLRNPSILILDEATAAMDTQTERKIQNALEILIKDKTTIMIAHRLSTLRIADTLLVLKDGKICESGTHDELIRAKGEYYKLYTLQLSALKNIGVEG